jgi:GNAT superfamily N-acetyltransferase
MLRVINEAAQAYKGVIPEDRWNEPYMPADELRREIEAGVQFYGWFDKNRLLGVMGLQAVRGTTLIRHAYVHPDHQRRGVGGTLLEHLLDLADTRNILVGTWRDATWAIRFYAKRGFQQVTPDEKDRLLRAHWDIPERQVDASVVLRKVVEKTGDRPTIRASRRKHRCSRTTSPMKR